MKKIGVIGIGRFPTFDKHDYPIDGIVLLQSSKGDFVLLRIQLPYPFAERHLHTETAAEPVGHLCRIKQHT